jgi:hypothetical protein
VGESGRCFVDGPEDVLIGLLKFVGKRISLKGYINHSLVPDLVPFAVNAIYIRDLKDIIVQEIVSISGVVEKSGDEKAGGPIHLFLTVCNEKYELSTSAAQRLALAVDRRLEIKCYISTVNGTKTIEKIIDFKRLPNQSDNRKTVFVFPCDNYQSGMGQEGNFGILISNQTGAGAAFSGSYHLAEDIWLKGGTPVYSVADGVVKYSDFSPTWTDKNGRIHWNLGNVIVIEHWLDSPEGELDFLCSFYAHLAHNRKVKVGDRVKRGQIIGFIGADRSEENGQYPAHLHFGLHKGPYLQIAPSYRREIEKAIENGGIDFVKKGSSVINMEQEGESIVVYLKDANPVVWSLLISSTKGDNKPISNWCQGYGNKDTLKEWLKPSEWIRNHLSPNRLPH